LRATLLVLLLLVASIAFVLIFSSQGPRPAQGPPQFAAQGGGGEVWMVGVQSTDRSALPNTGVRSVMQVITTQSSGSLAFWVSDDLSNNYWGQVGYFVSRGGVPVSFYQVWNLNSSSVVFEGSALTSAGFHTFSLYLKTGNTWDFAVDSLVIGSYDMRAGSSSTSYPVYAVSEEQSNVTFAFPSVAFAPALQVLRNGTWGTVLSAASYGSVWGIQGTLQNSSLRAGDVVVGGNAEPIPAGTPLWDPSSAPSTSAGVVVPPARLSSGPPRLTLSALSPAPE
jgi:hypothetical protein